MAQTPTRRNASYIKDGDSSTGLDSTRDKRVEDMGTQAQDHAAMVFARNRTDPNVIIKPNKRVSNKITPAKVAQAMSGTSYSKLLKIK